MSVDSYLELFTTLFGWAFYSVLWNVLVATGIVYLPFLGILIDNWREVVSERDGADHSLRRLEIEFFSALFVITLAAQPSSLTSLDANVLAFTPPPTLSNPTSDTATVAESTTSFGTSGFQGAPSSVNLPIWWYAVLATSAGINHAIIRGLPSASDMRAFEQQARLATIADPKIRAEVSQFYGDCFLPVRSRFLASATQDTQVSAILADFGNDDPDWLGSHVYLSVPGYYDRYRAAAPVAGWPYVPSRDTEYLASDPPDAGRPHCDAWWSDDDLGLRTKLIAQADLTSAGLSGLVVAVAPTLASEKQNDAVARTVLANAPPAWSNNDLVAENVANGGIAGSAERLLKGGLAAGGMLIASAMMSVAMTAILQGLPMVQAVLLLGIYALLPLLVILSRYSLAVLMSGALAIFTVKFWSVLWYLALWVDQNLIQSMYPDVNLFLQLFANPGEHDSKRMLLNLITTSLYLGLPLLWSAMMAWAGVHIGRSLAIAASPLAKPAENAGRYGGRLGQSLARIGRR